MSDHDTLNPSGEAVTLPALPIRYGQVFFAPGALFDRLKDRPAWFTALLLGAVMTVVGVFAIPADIWEEMFRAQMLEQGQALPEGVGGGNLFRIGGAVAAGIFWFVMAFISSGVTTLIFAFILGDQVRFKQILSGLAHAMLLPATGALVTLPLRVAQRDPQLVLSVGTFVPGLDGYLGAFLNGLDLFSLWAYFLIGLAISRFDPRRSVGSAVGIMIAMFVALIAVFAIFQA
jgi:hypothetical protein